MPKIKYREIDMSVRRLSVVDKANEIVVEYQAQGFDLTLRQLYYQFVSRGLIPNSQKEYKRLGDVVNDARLCGLIDWSAISDRTRELRSLNHWDSPAAIVKACAEQFHVDRWGAQPIRPEVWIEKDALVGVIEGVCHELDVSFFSCRGYTSQSEMWVAAQRLRRYVREGQRVVVLHFGDHDPSGLDMSRDIRNRLELFGAQVDFRRMALNADQVEKYGPPPNPAKITDSRFAGYEAEHGDESWELDALEPSVIVDLIRTEVERLRDEALWDEETEREDGMRADLTRTAERWPAVARFVNNKA